MTETLTKKRSRRVVTTAELIELLAQGKTVRLPDVVRPSDEVLAHYEASEVARLDVRAEDNPIVSVEYVRDEPVQCISVDHPRHLYITDDFIPTHNTSNIVFLKSTDDSMMETLSKMSGTRHITYRDSKTVTEDVEQIMKMSNVEGKVSWGYSVKEEPLISFNDMAFISRSNSILFRAGDAPVWNRNELVLPMSYRLFANKITHPGHDYTLQTIPTLSTAMDFDVRMNQPDFMKMLNKRMAQAKKVEDARKSHQAAYGLSDAQIARLDPDVYANEIMEMIDAMSWEQSPERAALVGADEDDENVVTVDYDFDDPDSDTYSDQFAMSDEQWDNDNQLSQEIAQLDAVNAEYARKVYAGGLVSRDMFLRTPALGGGVLYGALHMEIVEAYKQARTDMQRDAQWFSAGGDGSDLRSADGSVLYIRKVNESADMRALQSLSEEEKARVYADAGLDPDSDMIDYEITDDFYRLLGEQPSWMGFARGEFEKAMANTVRSRMDETIT